MNVNLIMHPILCAAFYVLLNEHVCTIVNVSAMNTHTGTYVIAWFAV